MKNSSNKKPTICFFGTYDKKYSTNKIVLDGFKRNRVRVFKVAKDVRITALNNQNHLSAFNLIKRLGIKLSLLGIVFKSSTKIKKCDAIYVGYPGHIDLLFAWLVAKLFRKKLIFYPLIILYITFTEDVRLFPKSSIKARLLKLYETFIYKLPDLIFSDIPHQKDVFINQFHVNPKKIVEVPIGADDTIYKYIGIKESSRKLNVVYYGLYSPLHGVEHMIKAANLLKNDKKIRFVMVGNGQTFEQNYALAKKYNLKNITFYNDVTEESAMSILKNAHIFLGHAQNSPTVFRTLPNKVYQGLALGKVVVTADSPASRGVFKNKYNAVLFQPGNASSLVKAILFLRNNPKKVIEISQNGYQKFINEFTPPAISKVIVNSIKSRK